jgi:excisionase family DNA binding protein
MSETLLGYADAAKLLRLPIGTVYALVSQKRIPHIRLGRRLVRFSEASLREWIAARSVGAGDARNA